MKRLLATGAAAIALSVVPSGAAHAAPLCTQPAQTNCEYCADPAGNPAPPQPCMAGVAGFFWVDGTRLAAGQCIVGCPDRLRLWGVAEGVRVTTGRRSS